MEYLLYLNSDKIQNNDFQKKKDNIVTGVPVFASSNNIFMENLGPKVPNSYVTKVKNNDLRNTYTSVLLRSDNNYVYCIDPFNVKIKDDADITFNLSNFAA